MAQGPGSPIALASYLADYDRRVREAHNMDSLLPRGVRLRDFPQWVMQQNVLAMTEARNQGLRGSEGHRAAYQCMGEGAT